MNKEDDFDFDGVRESLSDFLEVGAMVSRMAVTGGR